MVKYTEKKKKPCAATHGESIFKLYRYTVNDYITIKNCTQTIEN